MSDQDRRDFLKRSAAVVSAVSLSRCAPVADSGSDASPGVGGDLEPAALRAVAEAVLPVTDLGPEGVAATSAAFAEWVEGFEPVAERPHGYLNRGLSEIRYGPPHPGPRWAAQLEALDIEARKRHRSPFAELDVTQRRALIESQLDHEDLRRMPSPAGCDHLAVGLIAFFYDSSEANDLCHRAAIGRYTCRGLESVRDEPPPLDEEAGP